MKLRLIYFFGIMSLTIFLVYFSHKRNSQSGIIQINIDFNQNKTKFLDKNMVNKLLIQRNDTAFFLKEDTLDLKVTEDLLNANPMVASADIFRTPQGLLNVKINERKPIFRVINEQEEFYIDNFGKRVPLSKKYTARVPIFYGKIENNSVELVNFIKLILRDPFTKIEIIDFKQLNNSYILGLRSFPFKIIWGENSKYKEKLKKLKYLYMYLGKRDSLRINKVDLTFDKQIVLDYGQSGK